MFGVFICCVIVDNCRNEGVGLLFLMLISDFWEA